MARGLRPLGSAPGGGASVGDARFKGLAAGAALGRHLVGDVRFEGLAVSSALGLEQ
jgi:hypothetical protein